MPIRSSLKNQNYQDLTKDQRDNIAKKEVRDLARDNILKDTPFVAKEIAIADLSGLNKLLRSNTSLINTLIDFVQGPVPYVVDPNSANSFITTANKANFQFKEMINILDEYNNPEDIKKINPKDFDKTIKYLKKIELEYNDLYEIYRSLDEEDPINERIDGSLVHMLATANDFFDVFEEVEGSLRTFGGSVKTAGQRFYPENTGVERKLL